MLVKDIYGNEYKIPLRNYGVNRESRSNLHLTARELLKKIFSGFFVFEEVPIVVYPRKTLFVDFWVERYNIICEVAGQQHFQYNTFFHRDKLDFLSRGRNDRLKQEWAAINNFKFIELKYNEDVNEWREKITR